MFISEDKIAAEMLASLFTENRLFHSHFLGVQPNYEAIGNIFNHF